MAKPSTKNAAAKKAVAQKPAPAKAVAKKAAPAKAAPAKKAAAVKAVSKAPVKKAAAPAPKKAAPASKAIEKAPKTVVKAEAVAPKAKLKHIAIAGNIGAGKTTLTQLLSKHYGWIPNFEEVDNNPYLNDFYEDMPRWSFNLQVYFLNRRFKQIVDIKQGTETVIQDRTIHEDAFIFAPNLHSMGLMSSRDYENYKSLYDTISSLISPPDLLIYLRGTVPTLVNQIQKRGREYEDNLRLDYLRRLNEYYEKWIGNYTEGKLLIIDIDKLNFADEQDALAEVIQKIEIEINGLF